MIIIVKKCVVTKKPSSVLFFKKRRKKLLLPLLGSCSWPVTMKPRGLVTVTCALLWFVQCRCLLARETLVHPPDISEEKILQNAELGEDGLRKAVTVVLRKCCELDEVFVVSQPQSHCGKLPSNYNRETFLNITKQLFFPHDSPQILDNITTGFSQVRCDPQSLIRQEPQKYAADEFYPMRDGRLAVPRRFVTYGPSYHCMEDFVEDGNYHELKRGAFVCIENSEPFPASSIDSRGRFRSPKSNIEPEIIPRFDDPFNLSGKLVVRKCCDPNSVYAAQYSHCEQVQGLNSVTVGSLLRNNSVFIRSGFPSCESSSLFLSSADTNASYHLTDSGSLRLREATFEVELRLDDYCLDDFLYYEDEGPVIVVQVNYCYDEEHSPVFTINEEVDPVNNLSQGTVTYFPKCCEDGSYVAHSNCTKYSENRNVNQLFVSQLNQTVGSIHHPGLNSAILLNNAVFHGNLSFDAYLKFPLDNDTKLVFENETVRIVTRLGQRGRCLLNVTKRLPQHDFCIDIFRIDESQNDLVGFHPVLLYRNAEQQQSHVPLFFPTLLFFSAAALVATFIIYLFAPAQTVARLVSRTGRSQASALRLRSRVRLAETLFGRTLLCHIFSLTGAFITLAVTQLNVAPPGTPGCTALGLLVYFFFMASFAWLSVICFDLWWQFRTVVKVPDEFRFIPYSVVGWGTPVIAASVALAADFQDDLVDCERRPNFGIVRCWFYGDEAMLSFFYAPVSATLALNGLFFALLVSNLGLLKNCHASGLPASRGTKETILSKDQHLARKHNMWLGLRLLLIMGIPWLFEVLAWLPSVRQKNTWQHVLLQTAAVFNSLRGVVLFVIFILLRPKILRFVWDKVKGSRRLQATESRYGAALPRDRSESAPQDLSESNDPRSMYTRTRQQSEISTISTVTRTTSSESSPAPTNREFWNEDDSNTVAEVTHL